MPWIMLADVLYALLPRSVNLCCVWYGCLCMHNTSTPLVSASARESGIYLVQQFHQTYCSQVLEQVLQCNPHELIL